MDRSLALAALAYAALAVALTWPLVAHLSTHLPHDLGDPVLSSWLLWWHAHPPPLHRDMVGRRGLLPRARFAGALRSPPRPQRDWIAGHLARRRPDRRLQRRAAAVVRALGAGDACAGAGPVGTPRCGAGWPASSTASPLTASTTSSTSSSSRPIWLPVALLALHRWLDASAALAVGVCGCVADAGADLRLLLLLLRHAAGLWSVWFLRSWRRDVLPLAAALAFTLLALLPHPPALSQRASGVRPATRDPRDRALQRRRERPAERRAMAGRTSLANALFSPRDSCTQGSSPCCWWSRSPLAGWRHRRGACRGLQPARYCWRLGSPCRRRGQAARGRSLATRRRASVSCRPASRSSRYPWRSSRPRLRRRPPAVLGAYRRRSAFAFYTRRHWRCGSWRSARRRSCSAPGALQGAVRVADAPSRHLKTGSACRRALRCSRRSAWRSPPASR